jgi:hypothetical protein
MWIAFIYLLHLQTTRDKFPHQGISPALIIPFGMSLVPIIKTIQSLTAETLV